MASPEPSAGTNFDLVILIGPGVVLAIAGVIIAWLKWRNPPKDKTAR